MAFIPTITASHVKHLVLLLLIMPQLLHHQL